MKAPCYREKQGAGALAPYYCKELFLKRRKKKRNERKKKKKKKRVYELV
jgi:hypothetical protein